MRNTSTTLTLICKWCGADYLGDTLTRCPVCDRTRAEQTLDMHRWSVKHGLVTEPSPTGRVFVIDGITIPEVR